MKRILVPTDFSPNAESALRVAVDIAMRAKGTVILYHIYIPVEGTFIDNARKREAHNILTETIILKRLQRLKKKVLKDETKVAISTVIGRSPLINNILGFAEHNSIDLIVMGTKGASGIKKVLVGSVAAKVAQKTAFPVLMIPEKFTPKELASIVFASDLHPYDEEALSFTLSFAKLYNGNIKVVHILSPGTTEKKRQKEINDFDSYVYYMQRQFNKSQLKFQLLKIPPGSEKIETLYKEIPADMLVMVRSKKKFFEKIFTESFTKTIACMAKKPLLVIPPGEKIKEEAN